MLQKSKILIVDDNPVGRDVLDDLLAGPEYDLEFAADGPEALEKAFSSQPDLILLDVMLPGMNGFEVCHRLRASEQQAEVPVLLITSLDDQQARLKGIEAGADDFISKPFNRTELRARVRTITQLNRYRKLLDERAHLEQAHNNLLAAYDATIAGWSRAMDLRDQETEGHTRRVTEMTIQLARMINTFSEDELVHVRRGALLHDMGKLGVPDSILLKPGSLTPEEWAIMRKHPQLAYEMLSPIPYLAPALEIPYCHHEKWDGSGYPRGLRGEEIPLAARVFAVADVWDALTSDRPYRPAWSRQKALDFIRAQAGAHFEPRIVTAFLALIETEVNLEELA